MSHPLLWPNKIFFYPIGNTPAVCLTENLTAEDPARVLLLGCGDPRSILYTIHLARLEDEGRLLDLTCCDFEPGILARNILLFSMIAENHPIGLVWEIVFHLKLSRPALTLLTRQSERLRDLTESMASWNSGSYAPWLRICTDDTLTQIRRRFSQYAELASCTDMRRSSSIWRSFVEEYKQRYGSSTVNLSPSRAAGPFHLDAVAALSANFFHYWRTGTVSRNPTDVKAAQLVNPTMVFTQTGEQTPHYGTYPLSTFHLAEAYCMSEPDKVREEDLVNLAKAQFTRWCSSFRNIANSDGARNFVVRIFAGDALAFCRTLHHHRVTSQHSASLSVSHWNSSELILSGDYGADPEHGHVAPTQFNVIDTSNLVDHVGLLNLLIVASPLIDIHPLSTLYTETLLTQGLEDPESGFLRQLCMSPALAGILFGVAPTGYLTNFSSTSNVHEVLLLKARSLSSTEPANRQLHERIAWRIPSLGDPNVFASTACLLTSCSPRALSKILFDIYYQMFIDEDMTRTLDILEKFGPSSTFVHYHRGTFVTLLRLIKSRVGVDWEETMALLFKLLETDRKLFMGSNNYQELCTLLYLYGVYEVSAFRQDPMRDLACRQHGIDWSESIFDGWVRVPSIVCLVIVVPRERLSILNRNHGTLMIQCEVTGSSFRNVFSSIQVTTGELTVSGRGERATAHIREDVAGFFGTSSLVVSVWVSSTNLALQPWNTKISLSIHSTANAIIMLSQELGMELRLFQADLRDRAHIFVLPSRPDRQTELEIRRESCPPNPQADRSMSALDLIAGITTLSARWTLSDPSVLPSVKVVDYKQVSPCAIRVAIDGGQSTTLVYPFPVDASKPVTPRIARKSGWIEIVVPTKSSSSLAKSSTGTTACSYLTTNIPISPPPAQPSYPLFWSVHRLLLENLPILKRRKDMSWLNTHVSVALSDRERAEREQLHDNANVDVLVNVKETLHCLFNKAAEPNALKVYSLNANTGGVYTIIYLDHLRLDISSHTVVVDAAVLPLSHKLVSQYGQLIANLTLDGKMCVINTTDKEVVAWKHLIPVFVERCRTWKHTDNCEYAKASSAPLTTELSGNPICSCGAGLDLGEVLRGDQSWAKLRPFMTRIAISPLFAISWLESVAGAVKGLAKDAMTSISSPATRCAFCATPAREGVKLFKCRSCRRASYCGKECQTKDWKKTHKHMCKIWSRLELEDKK